MADASWRRRDVFFFAGLTLFLILQFLLDADRWYGVGWLIAATGSYLSFREELAKWPTSTESDALAGGSK